MKRNGPDCWVRSGAPQGHIARRSTPRALNPLPRLLVFPKHDPEQTSARANARFTLARRRSSPILATRPDFWRLDVSHKGGISQPSRARLRFGWSGEPNRLQPSDLSGAIAVSVRPVCMARDHRFGARAVFLGWRCEDREVSRTAPKRMKCDLAIPHGGKLTAQKIWRCAVLGGGGDSVYDPEACSRLECRDKIINQAVRLRDLMIHVHQDCTVERMSRQSCIVRFTESDSDVL